MLTLTSSCDKQAENITKTGFLVIDGARNHTSFDCFIPSAINDTLTLIENLKLSHQETALNMRQREMDFDLMRNSWAMTETEIYPDSLIGNKRWFISAVEITC